MATLPQTTRYFAAGTTECLYLPAVAAANGVPTRAEMTAGTVLTAEIADWSGWTVAGAEIVTGDLASTFDSKIPGKTSIDDSSITFHASLDGQDVRQVLPRTTSGFIMIMDGGDVPARPADVFPFRVRSVGKLRPVDGGSNNRLTISFSITREPFEDIPIPV